MGYWRLKDNPNNSDFRILSTPEYQSYVIVERINGESLDSTILPVYSNKFVFMIVSSFVKF